MDAMSDAIEGADVMLYGVSLAYKESANVRRGCYCLQLLFAVSPAVLCSLLIFSLILCAAFLGL